MLARTLTTMGLAVPDRILVAFIAELKPYGFWGISGPIAELS